jgi:uncharacterized phage protein gp47/JayE
MPTLAELLQPKSRQTILAELLDALRTANPAFPVTSWDAMEPYRAILEIDSRALAELAQHIPLIAQSGYVELAEGEWLTLLARNQFDLERKPAVFNRGNVTLTAAAFAPPYTVLPGQLIFGTALTGGLRWSNLTGGVLNPGGTLTLEVQAESPGANYNVAAGAIKVLHTPLPGVSVSNVGNWVTVAGVNEESDAALRYRCKLRWAELSYGAVRDAYASWALGAHPSISKIRVRDDHPRGQGTVDVILWGEGGLGQEAVDAANAIIQQRRPVTADARVYAATPRNVQVQAIVQVRAGFRNTAQLQAEAELARLQRDTPIGGTLYQAAVYEALFVRPYVINVNLIAPLEDVRLLDAEALVIQRTLGFEEVPA